MRILTTLSAISMISIALCSCSSMTSTSSSYPSESEQYQPKPYNPAEYESRLPQHISSTEKEVIVDPGIHAWGAYSGGNLIRGGLATAGSGFCPDLGKPCRTRVGTFHVYSLGGPECKSHIFPLPRGGAPMPFCMFFSGGQALHGSPSSHVVDGNVSHGCVRMHVEDAEWLRFNFVNVGTKVVVKPY